MTEIKLTPDQRKLVDEYADVRSRCAAWRPNVNPHAARLAELEPLLVAMAAGLKADEHATLAGNKHVVPVSARERKRTILKLPQLFRKLGTKWVAENCKPTLKAIEKALSPDDMKTFLLEERTGPRTLGEPVQRAAVLAA